MSKWVALFTIGMLCAAASAQPQLELNGTAAPAVTTQTAATQTQPAMSEEQMVAYSIGMNIGTSLKRQNVEVDVDALVRGMREALAGEVSKEETSRSIGLSIGSEMRRQEAEFDMSKLVQGLRDTLADKEPAITQAQMRQAMMSFMAQQQQKQQAANLKQAEENKAKGQAFLTENAKRADVTTLPSGLQYEVLKEGDGPRPTATDRVRVRYRGTLIEGTEFDASGEQPAEFGVGEVVRGWQEALQMMPVGAKWKVYLPANLAYGEMGRPPQIAPNAVLIFDMELVEIVK